MTDENKMLELEHRNQQLEGTVELLLEKTAQLSVNGTNSDDEIDLKELWNVVLRGWKLIVAITVGFAVISVFYALSKPNIYTSTAILAPTSSSGSSSISGKLGGLASLAGVNLGGSGGNDKSVIAMKLLTTWGFLDDFIKSNHLEVEVFAVKGWNKNTNQLIINEDVYDTATKKWVQKFEPDKVRTVGPSSWKLFESIKNKINITKDADSGLVTLAVNYYSPYVAKEWVDKIIISINKHMQAKDREDALRSIKYLKAQINKTNVAEMQSVFYQLIEEQTKTLMLAEISDEYVFKTLSPSRVAEKKSKPKRALIVIIGIILGGMFSLFTVFVRHFKNGSDRLV